MRFNLLTAIVLVLAACDLTAADIRGHARVIDGDTIEIRSKKFVFMALMRPKMVSAVQMRLAPNTAVAWIQH